MTKPSSAALKRIAQLTDPIKKAQAMETPKAHAAFLVYCTMENRSLAKLNEQLGAKPSYLRLLTHWSSKYMWQERVKQYDLEAMEEELRQAEKDIKKMNKRQADQGVNYQLKAMEHIERLIRSGHMGAMATVQLLKIALDAERIARGAEGEHTRLEITGADGGPIETDGTMKIMVYLPKKDAPPGQLALPAQGETSA